MLVGRIRSIVTFGLTNLPDDTGSTDLMTLAEIREFLAIPVLDTSRDTFLTSLIPIVSAGLERYLDRLIVKRRIIEVFPDNAGPLTLTHLPVVSVVEVRNRYGEIIPLTDIDVWPLQGTIASGNSNRTDLFFGGYTVTYDAGWEAAKIPPQIKAAALEWAKTLELDRKRDTSVAAEETVDVGRVEYTWGSSSSDESQLIAVGRHSGAVPLGVAMLVNSLKRRLS